MAYTVFDSGDEGRRKQTGPAIMIQPDLRIRLNEAAAKIFRSAQVAKVLVMWDPSALKMALRSTPETDRRGYQLGYHSGGGAKFTARAFLRTIGWSAQSLVRLSAHRTKDMFEVAIPAEYLQSSGNLEQRKSRKGKPNL